MDDTTKNVAEQFIQYLNEENFDKAESCLDPDFKFNGVLGSRESASSYIEDMKKMKFKYEILQTFTSDQDICFWYNINMGKQTVLTSGWYEILDGKIHSLKVLFDPRPLLKD
ncbi:nuclear transport factor 2 family protein [Chryseobacterium indologenes]|uniref:Nuclear transport factor 2 family protein n=2 Tax=Chryseobacterium indologenes TaxID=253 RepID=A0A3G5Z7C2_CHRID|nr:MULTISPECIES: nuclear transport factor 2 family protein [Chryseobacterium]ATN07935.1 nuclear transport factor 2 family protein [Chryseobacterium indologenes]AYY87220.1 nuclear transport factor 2 family protein [Chryseobacterium indologenes]AYZ38193.1 nuclear transport factor 2 family protein [Chryseobacterium indologenes]AZB20389.1 nuclear transport factor 2 family protein [Chryseobacterium indologenes]MBF6644917.1 nuclear transport factor 2 family protein [Chryseobacterium indologenes]